MQETSSKERDFRVKIGQNLKTIRESKGLSQEELAAIIDITRTTISKVENGKFGFSVDLLGKYSDVFGVNIFIK